MEVIYFITFKVLSPTLIRYTLTGSKICNGSSLSRDFRMNGSGRTDYLNFRHHKERKNELFQTLINANKQNFINLKAK